MGSEDVPVSTCASVSLDHNYALPSALVLKRRLERLESKNSSQRTTIQKNMMRLNRTRRKLKDMSKEVEKLKWAQELSDKASKLLAAASSQSVPAELFSRQEDIRVARFATISLRLCTFFPFQISIKRKQLGWLVQFGLPDQPEIFRLGPQFVFNQGL